MFLDNNYNQMFLLYVHVSPVMMLKQNAFLALTQSHMGLWTQTRISPARYMPSIYPNHLLQLAFIHKICYIKT